MVVYIVYRLVGRLGIPGVIGVFSTLEKAEEASKKVAKQIYTPEDDYEYFIIDDFIKDNFTIEKWCVDIDVRGE